MSADDVDHDDEHTLAAFDVPERALLRREFGGAVLAALAGAVLGGCEPSGPPDEIVSFVDRRPGSVPGVPLSFATATDRQGYAVGLLVRSRDGRPVKVEGNPRHPFSLGGTGAVEQAALWDLYDPDRLRAVRGPSSGGWRELGNALRNSTRDSGEGLHLLLRPTSSPILAELVGKLHDAIPRARVHFDPSDVPGSRWAGAAAAFGEAYEAHRDFAKADVIVAVGSDFLSTEPGALRAARHVASRRGYDRDGLPMNRIHAIESGLSTTGAYADHRHAARGHDVAVFLAELLAELVRRGLTVPDPVRAALDSLPAPDEPRRRFLERVARDVIRSRGRVAIEVGDGMPASTHVLGHALEAFLGTEIVRHATSPMAAYATSPSVGVAALSGALDANAVETLVVCGSNPCSDLPDASDFARRMGRARHRVVLASHADETVAEATWRVPEAHFLERWDVLRAPDGTWSFVQPLISPLTQGRTTEDVLGLLLGESLGGRERVEAFALESGLGATGFRSALRDGLVEGSALASVRTNVDFDAVAESIRSLAHDARIARANDALELHVVPDPRGPARSANNGWLRELPEPITKLVWDNAALVSPATAAELGVATGDVLRIAREDATIELPAFVQVGQADRTIVAWRGFGRRAGGRIAIRGGVDVTPLLDERRTFAPRVRATKTNRRVLLVTTQTTSHEVAGEPAAVRMTRTDYDAHPETLEARNVDPPSIYPDRANTTHQWSMAIDLAKCTGCSACVVACEVENNSPVVGKTQVGLGREMHWLRIDRYFDGRGDDLTVSMQPMLCQHCEKAPCEYVCPTAATVHSDDGLNQMVYNRCVGTRFCQNNCPYKIRRFNYFDYQRDVRPLETMRMNPDVTVRARGVMEKCTFCVQRIRHAESDADVSRRPLTDGDVQTACQQACPSGAIAFGLMSDPRSEVSRWRRSPRVYAVLGNLGVRPRVRYLARVDDTGEEAGG